MPHGSVRVGDVEVVTICDAVAQASRSIEASFPGAEPGTWDRVHSLDPGTIGPTGRWILHVHAFVVRSPATTVLFDAGIGSVEAPAHAWAAAAGRLPDELEAAGIAAGDIDAVVISHAHDDHIGGLVEGGRPIFPAARHLVQRADWFWLCDTNEEFRRVFDQLFAPLPDVQQIDGNHRLSDELLLVHAPGHTPGHQVLMIDSRGKRAILSADIANHPEQIRQPTLASLSDDNAEAARGTRKAILDRTFREERLMLPSHFAQPFGHLVREDGRLEFRPTR